jgi:hypothetical protein
VGGENLLIEGLCFFADPVAVLAVFLVALLAELGGGELLQLLEVLGDFGC